MQRLKKNNGSSLKYDVPTSLSSDSFTAFSDPHEDSAENNAEVKKATKILEYTIFDFAVKLKSLEPEYLYMYPLLLGLHSAGIKYNTTTEY